MIGLCVGFEVMMICCLIRCCVIKGGVGVVGVGFGISCSGCMWFKSVMIVVLMFLGFDMWFGLCLL